MAGGVGCVVVPIELGVAMLLDVAEQLQLGLVEHIEADHHIGLGRQSLVSTFPCLLVLACQHLNHSAFQHALVHHRLFLCDQQRLLVGLVYVCQPIPQGDEVAFQWCLRLRIGSRPMGGLTEELFDGLALFLI